MRNNKKQLIVCSIILILLVVGAVLIYGSILDSNYKVKSSKDGDITRYEWIKMLCERVGMKEYKNVEPYFRDVDEKNTCFSYIQSAYEWGIIDDSVKFEGDSLVSGRYIALTAMKTITQENIQIYLESENEVTEDSYISLAIEKGLIEEEQLVKGFTEKECEEVLDTLEHLYFVEFWKDDYSKVKYQKDVIEIASGDVLQSNLDCSEITVAKNVVDSLEKGTIIVFEQNNTKLKIARKIEKISNDGILTLGKVDLKQVVESLLVSDITELSFENVVSYYGLKDHEPIAENPTFQQMSVFPVEVESKGFKLSVSTKEENENKYIEVEIMDNATENACAIPINEKIEIEGDCNAEINIDRIFVGSQVDYSVLDDGLNYADVALDVQATITGEVNIGEAEKKILLCETPTPLGNGVLGINIEIYLVLGVDGSISFEAEIPMEMSVHYERGKGLRNFEHEISVQDATMQANCNASATLCFKPTLVIMGCLDVMDAEADVGIQASANVTNHSDSQICVDISVVAPVITLSVCGDEDKETLIGLLGLAVEWEIISSENAPYKETLHYEQLPDGTTQFVEECTYRQEDKFESTEGNGEGKVDTSETNKNEDVLDVTDLSRFYGYNMPLKFVLDYSESEENDDFEFAIRDTGSYYVVEGSIVCPEVTDVWGETGTHFTTASGRGYTVLGMESYNEDQRQKVNLLGDDGLSYDIVNLPAFSMDAYTGTVYYYITSEHGGKKYQTVFENVTLRIDYNTVFTDGETIGDTFDAVVKNGGFDNVSWVIAYDIHFSDDGVIDILTTADYGSNGMEAGPNTEIWIK